MPINPELKHLYPKNWREISRRIRFERAGGKCERCAAPHDNRPVPEADRRQQRRDDGLRQLRPELSGRPGAGDRRPDPRRAGGVHPDEIRGGGRSDLISPPRQA